MQALDKTDININFDPLNDEEQEFNFTIQSGDSEDDEEEDNLIAVNDVNITVSLHTNFASNEDITIWSETWSSHDHFNLWWLS